MSGEGILFESGSHVHLKGPVCNPIFLIIEAPEGLATLLEGAGLAFDI